MNKVQRRDAMLEATEGPEGFQTLRALVVTLVECGMSEETLIEDMEQIRGLLAEEHEDMMLDVMDQLVGYCSGWAKILPRPEPGDSDFGLR